MKAKSKILILLLTLALFCGIFAVATSAADTANPDGVTDYLPKQTASKDNAGKPLATGTWAKYYSMFTHITDRDEAYFRQFYLSEAETNLNQNTFGDTLSNYFSDYQDQYLTLEFDFSTETHFDSGEATSVIFLMRGSGPKDTVGIYFGYNTTDGNYVKLTGGEKVKIPDMGPLTWHHATLVYEPKGITTDATTNRITADLGSSVVLYLDGVKVAERTGGSIFPTDASNLAGVRVQTASSVVNKEKGDLCINNIVAKRVTADYAGDLSAVMDGTADLGAYDGLFAWNDTYAATYPTGGRMVAKIGDVAYADAQAAIDAAGEGDTVTLCEPIFSSGVVTVSKSVKVETKGFPFNYTLDGCGVKNDGTLYTFEKIENPAKVTVTVDGKTVESGVYCEGQTVASAGKSTARTLSDRYLYRVFEWKMTVDGVETTYTDAITADLYGKEVIYTAESFTRVAMVYTDASGVDHYIPYTDDATAATTFLQFFNWDTTQTLPDGLEGQMRYAGNDKLTLECDIKTATGILSSWKFAGSGKNADGSSYDHTMNGKCVLDLNGHEIRKTGGGTMFPEFRAGKGFFVVSSTPGARIVAESYSVLFTIWGGANVYLGGYEGTDGDNLSVYNFKLADLGSNRLACNGGHYYLLTDGQFLQHLSSGSFEFTNAKIYLGSGTTSVVTVGSAAKTNATKTTFQNCEIYSANPARNFFNIPSDQTAAVNLTLSGTRVFGVLPNFGQVKATISADCEFGLVTGLPELDDGYVYAHPVSPERSYDGFVDLIGKKLTAYGIANVKMLASRTAEVCWTVKGETVLTDRWEIGSTPLYTGTAPSATYEQDPDNESNVMVPGDTWLIGGSAITAITEAQAGTTLTAEAVFVSTPKAFEVTVDGKTTYYIDTDYETLRTFIAGMTSAAKIKLYTDYLNLNNASTEFKIAGTEFDLNGHTIRMTYKCGGGWLSAASKGNVYIYSSAPGAQILADEPYVASTGKGGGFIFGSYSGGTLTVGRTKDGQTFDRSYLTVKGTCLVSLYSDAVFDSITYINTVGDNWGLIQYWKDNLTVEVKDCDMWLTLNSKQLFAPRTDNATGGWSATVSGSRIYTAAASLVNATHTASQGKNPPGVTITDSVICSAVKMTNDENFPIYIGTGVRMNFLNGYLLADGTTVARTDAEKVTLGGNDFTLLYEVVPTADAVTVTVTGGTAELSKETWKKGSTPTDVRVDAFDTYYWYAKFTTPVTENTTLAATLKTTASKVSGNLTLYANITFNLYFKKDGFITGVTYNGKTVTFTDADLDSTGEYYIFKISDIAPKDLADAFTLEVLLANGEETATYTVKTSLAKYASSVLASEESKEGKTLVLALLDYVREMSVALGGKTADDAGIKAIDAGLKHYNYTRQNWTGTATIPTAGNITAASLHLASDPGFLFFLNHEKYGTVDEVTLTVNGVEKTYTVHHAEGENDYILVDSIHVSKYTDDLTVALDGETFTYNLGVYLAGFETIPDYAHALYSYSLAAKVYLAATAGN